MNKETKIEHICFAINTFLEGGAVATPETLKYFTPEAKREAIRLAVASTYLNKEAKDRLSSISID